jgi:NitT/TauT family transport system substrate-binding protein
MKRVCFVLATLAILGGLLPLAAPAAAQADLPELTLFLGFVPNVQFAPIYMAIDKGYFAEAGVNVVLEYGDENLGVERISVNDLQFGIISGEQVILGRAGGRPLVYVFEWYQRYPVGSSRRFRPGSRPPPIWPGGRWASLAATGPATPACAPCWRPTA